jgi:hypothetical protein
LWLQAKGKKRGRLSLARRQKVCAALEKLLRKLLRKKAGAAAFFSGQGKGGCGVGHSIGACGILKERQ